MKYIYKKKRNIFIRYWLSILINLIYRNDEKLKQIECGN